MDATVIVVAAIGAIAPTLVAALAWRQARMAQMAVNDRPSEAPTIGDDVMAIRIGVATCVDDVRVLAERMDRHLEHHWR